MGSFTYCEALTSITIPDSVKVIADMAFFHCELLTEITIPGSVKSLGHDVFSNCFSLKTITYNGTMEQWEQIDFAGDDWNEGVPAKVVHCTDGDVEI